MLGLSLVLCHAGCRLAAPRAAAGGFTSPSCDQYPIRAKRTLRRYGRGFLVNAEKALTAQIWVSCAYIAAAVLALISVSVAGASALCSGLDSRGLSARRSTCCSLQPGGPI